MEAFAAGINVAVADLFASSLNVTEGTVGAPLRSHISIQRLLARVTKAILPGIAPEHSLGQPGANREILAGGDHVVNLRKSSD